MRRSSVVPVLLSLLTLPVVAASAATAAPPLAYQVQDLGELGIPSAVNDSRVVVGVRQSAAGFDRGYRWDPRTRTAVELGTLGGYTSAATDVNDAGVIVGSADVATQDRHAFRRDPRTGRLTDLGTLGGPTSYATAVNARGAVAGFSSTATPGQERAFLWDPRTARMRDLGTLGGGSSQAFGIDDRGRVVGNAQTAGGISHAFRWDPATGRMTDLGVLPSHIVSFGEDANDRGQVVGSSASVGDETGRPFVWTSRAGIREVRAPGSAAGEAVAVSASGVVVGTRTYLPRAWAWDSATGAGTFLPTLADGTSRAVDISRGGTALGTAGDAGDVAHTVLWLRR